MSEEFTSGTIASPGIRIGRARVLSRRNPDIPRYFINTWNINNEISRFEEAVHSTKSDIETIQRQVAITLSSEMSDIFATHVMILEDPLLVEKAKDIIRREQKNAEWAINDIIVEYTNNLEASGDDYLKERIVDFSDLNRRIISNLMNHREKPLMDVSEGDILVAADFTPGETACMNRMAISAFVTDRGGRTSHTAIMARALGIPAIVGAINATASVKTGDMLIVDAIHGRVIINPSEEVLKEYKQYEHDYTRIEAELELLSNLGAKTSDNEEIFIYGNVEVPEEMKSVSRFGAHGIGLYRSEFLFMGKKLPDEEAQFQAYRTAAEFFDPQPVTIRTIDIGGDKIISYTESMKEKNPFLGCRAIRFCLDNEELFRIQLRAILRASAYGNVRILFPMISCVGELKEAQKILSDVKSELDSAGITYKKDIKAGIMIEVPSAAINADRLASYCDFFSVGTNDLVQYILAVDRINEKIARLYNPADPAVLRFLRMISDSAARSDVPVSICGEMAGDPVYTMLLIGLGFRHLSMSPAFMYQVKNVVRSVSSEECRVLAEELMTEEDGDIVRRRIYEIYDRRFNSFRKKA